MDPEPDESASKKARSSHGESGGEEQQKADEGKKRGGRPKLTQQKRKRRLMEEDDDEDVVADEVQMSQEDPLAQVGSPDPEPKRKRKKGTAKSPDDKDFQDAIMKDDDGDGDDDDDKEMAEEGGDEAKMDTEETKPAAEKTSSTTEKAEKSNVSRVQPSAAVTTAEPSKPTTTTTAVRRESASLSVAAFPSRQDGSKPTGSAIMMSSTSVTSAVPRLSTTTTTTAPKPDLASIARVGAPSTTLPSTAPVQAPAAEAPAPPEALEQQVQDALAQEEEEEVEENGMAKRLRSPSSWFLGIFLLQAVFWQFWVNPILSSVVDSSKVAVRLYKGILGQTKSRPYRADLGTGMNLSSALVDSKPKLSGLGITTGDAESQRAAVSAEQLALAEEIGEKMLEMMSRKEEYATYHALLEEKLESLESEVGRLGDTVSRRKRTQASATGKIARLRDSLQSLLDAESDEISSTQLSTIRRYLGAEEKFLVDISALNLWEIPETQCSVGLGPEKLSHGTLQWQKDIDVNSQELLSSESVMSQVLAWIDSSAQVHMSKVHKVPAETPEMQISSSPSSVVSSFSSEDVDEALRFRLEEEKADQTGRVDFACKLNGAQVLRSGPWATSRSLVDNLPILNRLAAAMSLRFYGYKAEAALTPTFPPSSLGQCWAFEKTFEATTSNGAFGTLSVRLALPVHVESIAIEHPSRDITDHSSTAIRSFRVVGFESPDADGKAWTLGTFEYQAFTGLLQEFQVEEDDIPKLSSISLAIDSNWGAPYACLYRFRVHGREG